MPTVARWTIKAGLIYFVLGLAAGLLIQLRPYVDLPRWMAGICPVTIHLLVVGWITELIIGVAYWMFPKFSKENPRGSEKVAWAVFFLLNAGLLLRVWAEPQVMTGARDKLGWALALSAALQLAAGWLFVLNTWARVKEH